MNSLKSKRPRSSQLTICVKDLYRPIVRQSASAMKRPCLNPYGFKLLKKSGKSASPLKISISKSNSSCSNNYKPNAKALLIRMLQNPETINIAGISENLSSTKQKLSSKYTTHFTSPKFSIGSQSSSIKAGKDMKPIFSSLHAEKLYINKSIYRKRTHVSLKLKGSKEKKKISVPRVELLSGWDG